MIDCLLHMAGGLDAAGTATASMDVYYPSKNTWVTKRPMQAACFLTGGAVINGKLYVVGGANGSTSSLATVEVYDHASDAWTTLTQCLRRATDWPSDQ